jgi:hypothetical protein
LDSKWTLVRLDGERAETETFDSRHGHEGSLGLEVNLPNGKSDTFYITFAGRHGDVPWTLFWATSELSVPFQPPGFSCDNTKAVKAGAPK